MNVLGSICAMLIQSVLTLMAATCVSVGQDMREMDTTVQVIIIVNILIYLVHFYH